MFNVETASKQEIFEYVITKLRLQEKQSSNGFNCVYNAEDGSHCAIGWLISAADYKPYFEQNTIGELVKCGLYSPDWVLDNLEFLQALQRFHDNYQLWDEPEHFLSHAKEFAYHENLNPAFILLLEKKDA